MHHILFLILKVLLQEKERSDGFLTSDDIDELLTEDADTIEDAPRETIIGYPTRPLYREIGTTLNRWLQTRYQSIILNASNQ